MKNTIIVIRTYDEEYSNYTENRYKYRGNVSVIISKTVVRIIEHDNEQKSYNIDLPERSAVTVRNWGSNI